MISRPCWTYMTEKVPEKIDLQDNTVKGSQFKQPMLEFSVSCAGCAEMSYARLITQLFGDHMIVSNATGCSSIWGGLAATQPVLQHRRTGFQVHPDRLHCEVHCLRQEDPQEGSGHDGDVLWLRVRCDRRHEREPGSAPEGHQRAPRPLAPVPDHRLRAVHQPRHQWRTQQMEIKRSGPLRPPAAVPLDNPSSGQGKNPLIVDSKDPTESYQDFIRGEVRYASLAKLFPAKAEEA